jgi:hypothetical protein
MSRSRSDSLSAGQGHSKVVSTLRARVQGLAIDAGTIVELRKSVMAGAFTVLPSSALWKAPMWKLAIYVSCIDTDCYKERDILAQLWPLKRATFADHGVDIEIVDMRSGFRFDGEWDLELWKYRRNEIDRCREQSIGLCFLTLQSNKCVYVSIYILR